jgi:AcrR family transcriptional regulator
MSSATKGSAEVVARIRKNSRRDTTRAALIEKAEKMFAESGIEGVSLRQIGAAIGSGNPNVVAYHFGSKEALLKEIFLHRLPEFEGRRAELLAIAERSGKGHDMKTLVHALYQPFFEQKNADGRHSYVAFIASISRANWGWVRHPIGDAFPVANEIVARIRAAMPEKARDYHKERSRAAFSIISSVLQFCDQNYADDPDRAKQVFTDALRQTAAAMEAPVD